MSETIVKLLACKLTEEEVAQKGSELATAVHNAEILCAEFKEQAKANKELLEEATDEVTRLSQVVRSHSEDRPVECYLSRRGDKMVLIRVDTMQVVEERPATQDEMQERLPGITSLAPLPKVAAPPPVAPAPELDEVEKARQASAPTKRGRKKNAGATDTPATVEGH